MEKISRRELLKAIIAGGGGIIATGFLPEKWLKPVVKSGVLPVHAQASAPEPTPIPDQNYVEGYGRLGDGIIFAEAFVSAVPFVYPEVVTNVQNSYKLASPVKTSIPTDQPVEGVEVTLFINGLEHPEKQTTNEFGYVSWEIQSLGPVQPNNTTLQEGDITLKFVIDGDDDEYVIIQEVLE